MRVRRFSLMRLRDEERGAVAAIVAICLICLIGMLVLTFDLGHGVALKRNMVNGADAGALAAARECGLANGDVAAKQAAADLVTDNNDAATLLPDPDGFEVDPEGAQCDGTAGSLEGGVGRVTVRTTVPVEYFFAPIFGINNGTVVASATAEWTMGLTNPAPIKVDQLKVEQCIEEGEQDAEGRVDCYFTFEKGKAPLNSDWGWLNLPEGWPNQKAGDLNPMKCSSQAGGSKDLGDYIGGMGGMGTAGGPTLLPELWDPEGTGNPPTWVCGSTGHKQSSVQAIQDWVDNVKSLMAGGELESEPAVLFPIVACDPAKTLGDPDCREWKYTPGVAYPVVKLQGFYVREAWNGQQARRQPNCHFTRQGSDVFCIHLQTTGPDVPTSGGAVIVRLVD
ncbi:MAG: pilus assembly protein TadG-related protein [Actinomycetota bacterium]